MNEMLVRFVDVDIAQQVVGTEVKLLCGIDA